MKNIVFNGVTVYARQYAIHRESNTLYYIYLCGHTEAVNAVLSGIASHGSTYIQFRGDPEPKLNMEFHPDYNDYILASRSYNSKSKLLSRPTSYGRAEGLFLDNVCNLRQVSGYFVVTGETMPEVEDRLFRVLDSKPIPLVPEWKDWLIATLYGENIIEPLLTYGCAGLVVEYDEARILELISEGIKSSAISVGKAVKEENLAAAA